MNTNHPTSDANDSFITKIVPGRISICREGASDEAYVEYEIVEHEYRLLHTFVPEVFRGHGIADKLVREAFQQSEKEKLTFVPICSYAQKWLERNIDSSKA